MRTNTRATTSDLRTHISWLRPRVILLLVSLLFSIQIMTAAQDALPEYQVKAAYLFNFLKFVEWPSDGFTDSLAPIVIGIVGDDPFENALPLVITGKTVQGRDLVIRNYHPGENLRGATILFISALGEKAAPSDTGESPGIERAHGFGPERFPR